MRNYSPLLAIAGLLLISLSLSGQIFVDSTGSNGFGDLPHPMAKSRFSNTDHEYNLFVRTTGVDTVRGVGIYNFLNQGNAEKFGIWNHIEQASGSNGVTYGLRNVVNHGGDADAYGVYNDLSNTTESKGRLFGNYSLLDDRGARALNKMYANFYGETIHRRKNNAYGSYLLVKSWADGSDKASYGQYVDIRGNGTAERYGVYSNINGGSGYAGYFVGDVHVNGTFTQASDERLKKNVKKINGALDIIKSLKPHTYNYKPSQEMGFGNGDETHYGFLAQEVAKVLPDLVTDVHHTYTETSETVRAGESTDELGFPLVEEEVALGAKSGVEEASVAAKDIRGVRYLDMIALLVGAVQEQEEEIASRDQDLIDLQEQLIKTQTQLQSIMTAIDQMNECSPCLTLKNSTVKEDLVDIHVYPNPTRGEFIVKHNLVGRLKARIRVTSTNGVIILNRIVEHDMTNLDASAWVPGAYILEVYDLKSNDLLGIEKILVK